MEQRIAKERTKTVKLDTNKMKVEESVSYMPMGAFGPVTITEGQRQASETSFSSEENLQPFITNSNSNLWFDNDADDKIADIRQNFKCIKEHFQEKPYTNKSNENRNSKRKRTHSLYDDDYDIFTNIFKEENDHNLLMGMEHHRRKNVMEHENNNVEKYRDNDLVVFERGNSSVGNTLRVNPSVSSETVPIYSNITNEALMGIQDNDFIHEDVILKSCKNALFCASQLLSSSNNSDEEDVPYNVSDKTDEDLIQEDADSHINRALILARSLIRETYRERALRRYHFKRKRRKFLRGNGRYTNKTRFAKSRPRINGKFVSMYTKCLPSQLFTNR